MELLHDDYIEDMLGRCYCLEKLSSYSDESDKHVFLHEEITMCMVSGEILCDIVQMINNRNTTSCDHYTYCSESAIYGSWIHSHHIST